MPQNRIGLRSPGPCQETIFICYNSGKSDLIYHNLALCVAVQNVWQRLKLKQRRRTRTVWLERRTRTVWLERRTRTVWLERRTRTEIILSLLSKDIPPYITNCWSNHLSIWVSFIVPPPLSYSHQIKDKVIDYWLVLLFCLWWRRGEDRNIFYLSFGKIT